MAAGASVDARGPLPDQIVDVGEAVVAGAVEVFDERGRGDSVLRQGLGTDGPDGGDPGQAGAGAPLLRDVDPEAGADLLLDLGAVLEGEQRGSPISSAASAERSIATGSAGAGRKLGWAPRNLRKRICV